MDSLPAAATRACKAAARPNPVAPRLHGTLSHGCRQPSSAATQRRRRLQATATDFEDYILDLQSRIIQGAEELDGSGLRFQHDRWTRSADNPNAGYGITSGATLLACSYLLPYLLTVPATPRCLSVVLSLNHISGPLYAVLEGGAVLEKAAANIRQAVNDCWVNL